MNFLPVFEWPIVEGNSDRAVVRLRDRWPVALFSRVSLGVFLVLSMTLSLSAKDNAAAPANADRPPLKPDVTAPTGDAPDTKVDAKKFKAETAAVTAKVKDLVKLVATRRDAVKSGSDTASLDRNIAMERVRLAQLKLRLAEAGNQTQPDSTSAKTLQALKRETLVRWGTPVNGVQIGFERISLPDKYSPGETVEFRRRVRNTTDEPMETTLRFFATDKMKPALDARGRIVLSGGGLPTESVTIKLQPGEDQPIPGSETRIQTNHILPGLYHVESYDRFGLNDTKVAAEQIYATSPGWTLIPSDIPLTFELISAAPTPVKAEPFVLQGGPEIAWGSPVQGLQAGLRYTRGLVKPAEFSHPRNWEWDLGESVKAEFLVRNILPKAVPVTYAVAADDKLVELDPQAHTVQVHEVAGAIQPRRNKSGIARVEGHEPTDRERTQVLQPGEAIVIARTDFQLLEKPPQNDAAWANLPRVNAVLMDAAGKYSFSTRLSVRSSAPLPLTLSTGRTRLWLRDPNAGPVEPPAVEAQGTGQVTVRYDMPGAAPQSEFSIRSLAEKDPVVVATTVQNGDTSRPIDIPAGQYEVSRQLPLEVGSWRKAVSCERQRITVTAGKVIDVRFERPGDNLVELKGVWKGLAAHPVEGALLTVHPIAENSLNHGNPDDYFDFEINRETVAATTCGRDGKFSLEPLPPGHYAVVLRAVRESDLKDSHGTAMPRLVGVETVTLLPPASYRVNTPYYFPAEFRIRTSWNTP